MTDFIQRLKEASELAKINGVTITLNTCGFLISFSGKPDILVTYEGVEQAHFNILCHAVSEIRK